MTSTSTYPPDKPPELLPPLLRATAGFLRFGGFFFLGLGGGEACEASAVTAGDDFAACFSSSFCWLKVGMPNHPRADGGSLAAAGGGAGFDAVFGASFLAGLAAGFTGGAAVWLELLSFSAVSAELSAFALVSFAVGAVVAAGGLLDALSCTGVTSAVFGFALLFDGLTLVISQVAMPMPANINTATAPPISTLPMLFGAAAA